MKQDVFDQRVMAIHQRLQVLKWQARIASVSQPELQTDALETLATALEELHVAQEELLQQNNELIGAQQAIETERQRYQELFEFAPDAYLVTDAEGTIQEANHAAAALLRVRWDFLIRKPLLVFIAEAERGTFRAQFLQVLRTRQVKDWEARLYPRDGKPVDVSLTTAATCNPQGKVVAVRWLLRDITARKQAEEELRQAKKAAEATSRTKSEFLATMSHELRTPLSIIIGYTDLLLDGSFGPVAVEQDKPLRRIERNARELLTLISAVLDLSRLEAEQLPIEFKEVRAHDLLKEIDAETQELQKQPHLVFEWQVANNLPRLHTDPAKLKIVLKHLIGNAVKFTDQGSVTVAARHYEGGLAVSVMDTGIGISQEMLGIIFEPFRQANGSSTRRHGGTGLGLYITKRLLELLGGTITVESTVGQGSTFRIWVPTSQDAPDGG